MPAPSASTTAGATLLLRRALRRVAFGLALGGAAHGFAAPAAGAAAPPARPAASAAAAAAAAGAVDPAWFDAGRPTARAHQALARLLQAGDDGLEPADYNAAALAQAYAAAAQGPVLAVPAQQRLQRALTLALARWLADLHHGRGDAAAVGAAVDAAAPASFDAAALLRRAEAGAGIDDAWRAALPAWPQYALLRQALARYRAMDAAAWRQRLPALPARSLEPGQPWAGLPGLAARLQVLGDLGAPWAAAAGYDAALVDAVRAFQARHGLDADGRLGRGTLAALEVAPPARARQIALNLERLRWAPPPGAARWIEVNVPSYTLQALVRDAGGAVEPVLAMRVIVGRARLTPTPPMQATLRAIEFSPHWNVPISIARSELVPRLRREPGIFEQQGYEFVGRDGRVASALDDAQLEAVLRGEQRLRQRPGPHNALGDIKFVFPNSESIYMHHTPSVGLFERARRDFSHGCIRVQDPVALAAFVLHDDASWTEARIREAMASHQPHSVRVAQPLPVRLDYLTARVEADGVHLWADVYGADAVLDAALRQRSSRRQAALARGDGQAPDEP